MNRELIHHTELLRKVAEGAWQFTSDSNRDGCTHWTSFKADGQEFYLYAKPKEQRVVKDELLRTEQDLRKDIGRLDRQIDWVKEEVKEMNRYIRVLNEHRDAVRYSLTVIAGIVVFTLAIVGVSTLVGE